MKQMTLSEVAPLWITARSYAPSSRKLREIQVRDFVDVVGDVDPADVELVDVLRWWSGLEGQSTNTRRSSLMAMRNLFRWMVQLGMTPTNPVEAIRVPPEPDLAPNAVTVEELGRLWSVTPDGPMRLVIALAAGAGLRRAEILSLRGNDVDRSAEPWLITVRRKGGKVQVLPVESPWLRAELAGLPRTKDLLVAYNADYLTTAVKRLMLEAGIENRSLHSLRHFFAQDALRRNPVNRVQQLMGHKSLGTTGRYLAI